MIPSSGLLWQAFTRFSSWFVDCHDELENHMYLRVLINVVFCTSAVQWCFPQYYTRDTLGWLVMADIYEETRCEIVALQPRYQIWHALEQSLITLCLIFLMHPLGVLQYSYQEWCSENGETLWRPILRIWQKTVSPWSLTLWADIQILLSLGASGSQQIIPLISKGCSGLSSPEGCLVDQVL